MSAENDFIKPPVKYNHSAIKLLHLHSATTPGLQEKEDASYQWHKSTEDQTSPGVNLPATVSS